MLLGLSISSPGGEDRGLDTEAFYEFLKCRGSGIITVPADRWNAEAFHGTAPGKICTVSISSSFIFRKLIVIWYVSSACSDQGWLHSRILIRGSSGVQHHPSRGCSGCNYPPRSVCYRFQHFIVFVLKLIHPSDCIKLSMHCNIVESTIVAVRQVFILDAVICCCASFLLCRCLHFTI